MCLNDAVTFGVEGHRADGRPVSERHLFIDLEHALDRMCVNKGAMPVDLVDGVLAHEVSARAFGTPLGDLAAAIDRDAMVEGCAARNAVLFGPLAKDVGHFGILRSSAIRSSRTYRAI